MKKSTSIKLQENSLKLKLNLKHDKSLYTWYMIRYEKININEITKKFSKKILKLKQVISQNFRRAI